MSLLLAMLLLAQPRPIFADGGWASFDRGSACDAGVRAERIATDRSSQAHAGFAFDRDGPRHGQFAAKLSRPLAPGATVILTVGDTPFLLLPGGDTAWSRGPAQEVAIVAAARAATSMRIEARSPRGGRFVDRYTLDGAPGAIDAAAACSAKR